MTPLVMIVGFLGAGKTTFLKQVLPALGRQGLKPQVILNDYQNAKVDAEQLRPLVEEVQAISGDCVCCGSKDELLEQLRGFTHVPGRVVLLETNGTTDSENLIEWLSLEPTLKDFTLPIQVSLIDAQRWQKRFWHNALEREQARTASHVCVSRRDSVKPERLAEVEASLEKHDVRGRQVTAEEFAQELAVITAGVAGLHRHVGHACGCGHDHGDHEHHHHDHEHGHEHHHDHASSHHFASLELALPEQVEKAAFQRFLKSLPDEVIRAKGLVCFKEEPGQRLIFQKVDRFDEPQFFPVEGEGTVPPVSLFIGPELPEERLRAAVADLG